MGQKTETKRDRENWNGVEMFFRDVIKVKQTHTVEEGRNDMVGNEYLKLKFL